MKKGTKTWTHRLLMAAAALVTALAMLSAPAAAGFGIGTTVEAEAAAKIKLSATKATLNQGASKTLTLKKGKTAVKGVKWSTSNKKVATVKSGKVTAVSYGTAKIRAKSGKKTYTCAITVRGLNKKSQTLTVGQSSTLSLGKLTKKQQKGSIKWSTSNKNIVTIKKASKTKYKVTAKKDGTAKVTAKVGKTKYACTIKVKSAKASAKVSTEKQTGTIKVSSKSNNTATALTSVSTNSSSAKSSTESVTPLSDIQFDSTKCYDGHTHIWVPRWDKYITDSDDDWEIDGRYCHGGYVGGKAGLVADIDNDCVSEDKYLPPEEISNLKGDTEILNHYIEHGCGGWSDCIIGVLHKTKGTVGYEVIKYKCIVCGKTVYADEIGQSFEG